MGNRYLARAQMSWRDVLGRSDARESHVSRASQAARRKRTADENAAFLVALAERMRPYLTGREVKRKYLAERFDVNLADVATALELLSARVVDGSFYTLDPA